MYPVFSLYPVPQAHDLQLKAHDLASELLQMLEVPYIRPSINSCLQTRESN